MKKQTMSLAVTAALLGGAVSANGAMYVNDRGLGEALVYPFYSAANGNDTYVHIVNTTSLVKAVKVRFIEAQNSQEVLDFNLYLSPEDEWAGAITADPNGDGAIIRTVDNSCTVPQLGTPNPPFDGTQTDAGNGKIRRDQPFVDFKYDIDGEEDRAITRTLEGYVEVIEMGQLDPESGVKGPAAVHNAEGVPANCQALVAAWSLTQVGNETTLGDWRDDAQDELLESWQGGGLYGYGVVINVPEGTAAGYDATAIEGFNDEGLPTPLHFRPGFEEPSLADATEEVTIFNNGVAEDHTFNSGVDAASSLFMTTDIANDYVVDADINALTDWVVTMPTKRFYVASNPAVAPFTNYWDGEKACEPVAISHWDREEAFVPPPEFTENPGFSPRPDVIEEEIEDFQLCTEVSIISFGEDSALNATSSIRYGFQPDYNEGWASLSFLPGDLNDPDSLTDINPLARELADDSGNAFFGLPAVGFAVFNYQNGELGGGVLSNYAASSEHKTVVETGSATVLPPAPPAP